MRARDVSHATGPALGLLACVLLVGPAAAVADEADDLIKQILRETRGGAAAAKELVDAAKGLSDAPVVQKRLCEKAYECGISSPLGYASALAAMDLLEKIAPARAAAWDDKRLEVYRLQYLRGDRADRLINGRKYVEMLLRGASRHEKDGKWSDAAKVCRLAYGLARTLKLPEATAIYQRMRDANHWIVVYSRLDRLKAAVEKNPDDTKSRKRLVETYLIDLDMPAEASKCLSDSLDAALRKNVSMAAREASELADADFLTLGQWYRSLATKTAVKTAKVRLLTRARDNLKMYLEVYTKKDVQRLRVVKMLKAVEADLKRLGADLTGTTAKGQTLTLKLAEGVTMKFVRIPAGRFTMGSAQTETGRKRSEGPQLQVTISPGALGFYMGVTEVTQAQYAAVTGKNPSKFKRPNNPVEHVSWNDCVEFCRALSEKTGRLVRLPTEAEWEYACRAGTTTTYSFGDDSSKLGDYAWYKSNAWDKGEKHAHPVRVKKPNAWGLYDMHGNVWEYCADWYGSYASADTRNPKGPATGKYRVLRGGSWDNIPQSCRAAFRFRATPVDRGFGSLGFRVVVVSATSLLRL